MEENQEKHAKKRLMDESDLKQQPFLIKFNKDDSTPHSPQEIYVSKDKFKIGRAIDNDEILCDLSISRKQCVLDQDVDGEWNITNLGSSNTYINDVPLKNNLKHKLIPGDKIQFSENPIFKYIFALKDIEDEQVKKICLHPSVLRSVLSQRELYVESQDSKRNELKTQLENKEKEHNDLKQKLEDLLSQQKTNDQQEEDFKKEILDLRQNIESVHGEKTQLELSYDQVLAKLEDERAQFELKLNEEKKKLEEAVDMSKQEKEILETRMKEEMTRWQAEQQTEWRKMMEHRMWEEKNLQAQLLSDKITLEQRLMATEQALEEQKAKIEMAPKIPSHDICIIVDTINESNLKNDDTLILDTIDLTGGNSPPQPSDYGPNLMNKVGDIMDEQLTCSICSELFITATTLNCSHTFCSQCIQSWMKKQRMCPVCRAPTKSMNRALVLDNFIESMIENLAPELKEDRKQLVKKRIREETPKIKLKKKKN